MTTIRFPLAVFLAAIALTGLRAEDTLILNPSSAVSAISEDQLKDIFLGKKLGWEDGSKIVIAYAKDGASNESLMKRLGKNAQQFQTGWKKLVFTGKGSMPEQVDNDEAAIAFVAKTPGAIALVDKAKVKDGVKAIAAP